MYGQEFDTFVGMSTREAAAKAREEFVSLQRDLNVLPSGLTELAGITGDDVGELAKRTVESQQRLLRCNPRPVTKRTSRTYPVTRCTTGSDRPTHCHTSH